MQHIVSCAADPCPGMPHTNTTAAPRDLQIDFTNVHAHDADRVRPISSPIALEGIDLSSIEGGIGGLSHHNALASSPPRSPRHNRDPSKNSITDVMAGKTREPSRDRLKEQQDPRGQVQQGRDGEEYRPGSSSMSKIYHLRKAPGSTPELSLVGSAESVAKDGNNGEYGILLMLSIGGVYHVVAVGGACRAFPSRGRTMAAEQRRCSMRFTCQSAAGCKA